MHPRLDCIVTVALIMIVWCVASTEVRAKVVREEKGPSNPAIDAGGHHLGNAAKNQIPYSLIGAIAIDGGAGNGCGFWPWTPFDLLNPIRHDQHRQRSIHLFDDGVIHRRSLWLK